MELTLTVQPPSAPAIDVDLNVDGSRPVSDVVDALVRVTGMPTSLGQDLSIYLPLRDTWVNNELMVSQAHLRVGEVVVLGRQTNQASVIIGDVVEKTKVHKNAQPSQKLSPYELCVVSGEQNGTRFHLTAQSIVIVDGRGRVRVSEAQLLARRPEPIQELEQKTKVSFFENPQEVPQIEYEGITRLDAGACMIEAANNIHITPITGKVNVEVRGLKERIELDEHAMITCGGVQFFIRKRVVDEPLHVSERGIVGINRPPRDMQPPTEKIIEIEAPPRDAPKTRISPVMIVLPLMFGIVMAIVMSPYFLMFGLMSPLMMIGNSLDTKRTGRKEYKAGKERYIEDIESAVHTLRIGRREELAIRRIVFPDAPDCAARVLDGRHDLWDRRRDDIDFLAYRIGVGDQLALISANIAPGGSDELRDYGERRLRRTDPIKLAPLAIPLPQFGAMGVVGDRANTRDLVSWMILQTMTLHSHRDVSLCAALSQDSLEYFEYMKWIPHVRHGGAEIDEPTISFGPEHSTVLFQKLRSIIDSRMHNSQNNYQQSFTEWPSIVVFIDESVVRERTSIDQILKLGPSVGVFTVFLSTQFRDLPGECKAVVEVTSPTQDDSTVAVSYPGSGLPTVTCNKEAVNVELVKQVAQILAPMRDMTASMAQGGGGSLPKSVRLLDVLDLGKPTVEDIAQRWAHPPESLQAVLGVTSEGLMKVDMRVDGPHALVAGTTGAGKSELLQTFVASIASNYSPEKVNFLFVDYKGGSAFANCSDIPHSVGMVTDLDEYLAQRVLISLNAELKRREALLREYGAKDLIQLEKRFPAQCPPSLLIVIDEFAALVREVPDFVEGVVDIAQRGRSLGLHLILATQRPAGVVNDNIRANTNLRIALRIADTGDSNDVIGTDEAARIPRTIPGRAFVRKGPSELQGFQTAYGGDFTVDVNATAEDGSDESQVAKAPITINPFSILNVIELPRVDEDLELNLEEEKEFDPDHDSDLKYLCNIIIEAASALHLPEPKQPWKQPLPKILPLHTIGDVALLDQNDPGRRVILGMVDLPQLQDQQVYTHDFESDGNMFIYGTSSSGKTTSLRSIAGSIAVSSKPSEAVIYAIDCASGGLECLKELPHTAAVISTREAEGMSVFLTRMAQEVETRKELFRQEGVASLGEYRQRLKNNGIEPTIELPRIHVLIDSFAGYQAAFEKIEYGAWIDAIQRLTADGRPLGIHVVITADRRGAIPFNMAGLVEQKLILRMADSEELSSLGVPSKIAKEIKLPPGRGLLRGELEIQVPTVSANPDGISQVQQIVAIGKHLREMYGERSRHKVASLPDQLFEVQLDHTIGNATTAMFGAIVANSGLTPFGFDFSRGHFVVSGPRASGKTTALKTIATSLSQKEQPPEIYVFTPRPNELSIIGTPSRVAVGLQACEQQLDDLMNKFSQIDENDIPEVMFIMDDSEDMLEGTFAQQMESFMHGMKQKLHIVAAGDPSAFLRSYNGWVAEVKKHKCGLLLNPDFQTDGDITGVKIKQLPGQIFPPGRGYICIDRNAELIQVAM